jgi:hypothetical protein
MLPALDGGKRRTVSIIGSITIQESDTTMRSWDPANILFVLFNPLSLLLSLLLLLMMMMMTMMAMMAMMMMMMWKKAIFP